MSKLIKLSNFFIFSLSLLVLFLSNNYTNITNSILAIIPNSENKEILQAYEKYSNTKSLIVAVKGQKKDSFKKIKSIENKLLRIDGISLKNNSLNQFLHEYKTNNQLYLKEFNRKKSENLNIKKELEKIKDTLLNSFFPTIINKQDPLKLFISKDKESNYRIKDNYLVLENYGLLRSFKLDKNINSLNDYQRIYKEIEKIHNDYKDIKIFSTTFYFVENSKAIKEDVNKIVIFALSILLLLYLVILRDLQLLLNTITTLGSSAILSTIVITSLFSEVSIFVLVFGLSISTVAIDYMFHHYMHDYYKEKKEFNKEVFFGFFTTLLAFVAISFISFTLIKQIAIFTIVSLFISYLHFSFLYPKIGFKLKKSKKFNEFKYKIESRYILLLSIILIVLSFSFINFDTNLRNLDYKNEKLDSLDLFFKEKLNQKEKIPLLIKTKNIEELISKYKKIKSIEPNIKSSLDLIIPKEKYKVTNKLLNNYQFEHMKTTIKNEGLKLGFKEDFFKEAYLIKPLPKYDFQTLERLGISFFEYNNSKFIFLNIKKEHYLSIKKLTFIKPLSMKHLFEDSLKQVKDEIITLGLISLALIVIMIFLITKENFLFALSFLLFPLGIILCYSYFTVFNILHIFMMFIILAISIDYAIYSSKSLDLNTKKAILFSLLSTFAGFGVLIFSQINSLYSIGTIATIGILSISFLLIFTKRFST